MKKKTRREKNKFPTLGARILKPSAFSPFRKGVMNMHPGILPDNRGLDTIKWAILNNKVNIQEYVVRRAAKEKMAKLRNANIRLSNIHSGRLLMNLRGQDKWIK